MKIVKSGVKAVKKAVKKIGKGLSKIYKKVTKTTLGKVLMGSAAIYLGGWALGYWGGPSTLFGGGAAAGTGSGVATTTGSVAAPGAITTAETVGATTGGVGGAIEGAVSSVFPSTAANTGVMPSVAKTAVPAVKEAAGGGILKSFLANPTVQATAAGAVSGIGQGLMQPDPRDELRAQEEARQRRIQQAYGGIGSYRFDVPTGGQTNYRYNSPLRKYMQ